MAERKDYYKILGITDEEKKLHGGEFEELIKKKYRKIALANHPDRQQGKSEEEKKRSEDAFKEASEAYEVLKDESKRAEYDNPASNFQFNDTDFSHMDINDIFSNFMGFGDFGFGGRRQEPRTPVGQGIRINITITLEEAFNGVKKTIKYKRYEACDECHGSGMTKDSKQKTCRTCGGTGQVFGTSSIFTTMRTCPTCGGSGSIIENPCKKCGGHGLVLKDHEMEINIPVGIEHGMQLSIANGGHMPPHANGKCGDLYVVVSIKHHELFDREGRDIYLEKEVPVLNALLGGEIEVETIDGKKLMAKVPECCEDGAQLRFRGYGMTHLNGGARGNMIVIIRHKMPKKLTAGDKEKLNELIQSETFK